MGIQSTTIDAEEVVIKTTDSEIVIHNPQVAKVNMMGQETLQVTGTMHEREIETEPEINEDDVKTVMEQANVSEEEAKAALEANSGDLAAAIMSLQK